MDLNSPPPDYFNVEDLTGSLICLSSSGEYDNPMSNPDRSLTPSRLTPSPPSIEYATEVSSEPMSMDTKFGSIFDSLSKLREAQDDIAKKQSETINYLKVIFLFFCIISS